MMTRKHYVKIAALLDGEMTLARTLSRPARSASLLAVRNITLSMADILAQDNPRFDRERFYAAAGLTSEELPR